MEIEKKLFGLTNMGKEVYCYKMKNQKGASVSILNYGCRILSICIPDKNGNIRDVCLGYDTIKEYEQDTCWFGALAGRCANRIANGQFLLNGMTYTLAQNNGNNHLHGGIKGFSEQVWDVLTQVDEIVMSYDSVDGEEGYPGNLKVQVSYQWTDDNELHIAYKAVSDQDTIVNLTNHSYFNLEGIESENILEHELWLDGNCVTEINQEMIPTGLHLQVESTPFDFRKQKSIGADIEADHLQLKIAQGYDHNYVLNGMGLRKFAFLYAPKTGIGMECYTDQKGVQLYTGNAIDVVGKAGKYYGKRSGVCLETQDFPNAINEEKFPTVIRKAGQVYETQTSYKFTISY